MPFEMGWYVQSVVVQGVMYVGGGYDRGCDGNKNNHIVMLYDISSENWSTLPPYRACDFAITAVNKHLMLVGGYDQGHTSNVLGVWSANSKEWTHPYPEMLTARSKCSAVVYDKLLVIAGGWSDNYGILSSVEIMNIESKQWYQGPPTPIPWQSMRVAVVGDKCYFMGGSTTTRIVSHTSHTDMVYCLSFPSLISHLNSCEGDRQIWRKTSRLFIFDSTPLAVSGSLLAVGGRRRNDKELTTIKLYQPETKEWVTIAQLPIPRYYCTCRMISDREIIVAGGSCDGLLKVRVDIGHINN